MKLFRLRSFFRNVVEDFLIEKLDKTAMELSKLNCSI